MRRRLKAQSRQARAPRGRSQARPLFGSGRIHLEIGDRIGAICFGGYGVIRELINGFGLVHEIKHRRDLFKRHFPYHESDHILSVACNILCGRERLGDLNRLRSDVPYTEALGAKMIPSPTAAGDFMRRFTEAEVIALMEAFHAVRP